MPGAPAPRSRDTRRAAGARCPRVSACRPRMPPPTRRSPLFLGHRETPADRTTAPGAAVSVQTLKTSARAARRTCAGWSVHAPWPARRRYFRAVAFASMSLLLSLQLAEICIEALESCAPSSGDSARPIPPPPAAVRPAAGRGRVCALAAANDESGTLQHLQVLRKSPAGSCRRASRAASLPPRRRRAARGSRRRVGSARAAKVALRWLALTLYRTSRLYNEEDLFTACATRPVKVGVGAAPAALALRSAIHQHSRYSWSPRPHDCVCAIW